LVTTFIEAMPVLKTVVSRVRVAETAVQPVSPPGEASKPSFPIRFPAGSVFAISCERCSIVRPASQLVEVSAVSAGTFW